jgi:hypothetical protein
VQSYHRILLVLRVDQVKCWFEMIPCEKKVTEKWVEAIKITEM